MLPAVAAISSAKTTEYHMPSTPKNIGNTSTAPSSNTKVRKKDISADTCPLFRAVKKAELNIARPVNRYATEIIRNACTLTGSSVAVPYRNRKENGWASTSERTNIDTDVIPMRIRLLFRRFLSSI